MSLEPGTTLGSYHVTAKIGEGGMGEVYRARDTKLDRDVALKVLPQAFTGDLDRATTCALKVVAIERQCHGNIGNRSSVSNGCTPKAFSDIDTSP